MMSDACRCEQVRALYLETRADTERLAAPITPEDAMLQSMPDASPSKWHLAHTSWFFDIFVLSPLARQICCADWKVMFNSYYQGIGKQYTRASRGMLSRPSLAEIVAYRHAIDAAIQEVLATAPTPQQLTAVELGCHHEMQHQELFLTDLQHALFASPVRATPYTNITCPLPRPATACDTAARDAYWHIDGGVHAIGADPDAFSFDNERPRHQVLVQDFALAKQPVTNGDYVAFIEDDGYNKPEYWSDKGWRLRRECGWQHPLYWYRHGNGWRQYQLDGDTPLQTDTAVAHLSWHEAHAYARWAGKRLPSEYELELAMRAADNAEAHSSWGQVWEWTQSAYLPYPKFRASAGAVGEYNGKFMVDQIVLRGSSRLTPRRQRRASYRNFFPSETRWQCAGIRLAHDL